MKTGIISRQQLKKIKKQAEKMLEQGRGSHDFEHTIRVLKLAERIARLERADLNKVRAAAWLHDIARHDEDRAKGRICHATMGAAKAFLILKKTGVGLDATADVCHAVRAHRFRDSIKPRTKTARVLFDADKLDSIGAVGIGRAFLFAGEVGAKLHNKGADLSKTKAYTEDDTAYREFMVKLRKVKSRMLTRAGRKMAAERHNFMKEFFKRLDLETAGKI